MGDLRARLRGSVPPASNAEAHGGVARAAHRAERRASTSTSSAPRDQTNLVAAERIARYKSGKYTVERPLHLGAALAGRFGEPRPGAVRIRPAARRRSSCATTCSERSASQRSPASPSATPPRGQADADARDRQASRAGSKHADLLTARRCPIDEDEVAAPWRVIVDTPERRPKPGDHRADRAGRGTRSREAPADRIGADELDRRSPTTSPGASGRAPARAGVRRERAVDRRRRPRPARAATASSQGGSPPPRPSPACSSSDSVSTCRANVACVVGRPHRRASSGERERVGHAPHRRRLPTSIVDDGPGACQRARGRRGGSPLAPCAAAAPATINNPTYAPRPPTEDRRRPELARARRRCRLISTSHV